MALRLEISGVAHEVQLTGFNRDEFDNAIRKLSSQEGSFSELFANEQEWGGEEINHDYCIDNINKDVTITLIDEDDESDELECSTGVLRKIECLENYDNSIFDNHSHFIFLYSTEEGFRESYTLPECITKDNFDISNIFYLVPKINLKADEDCVTEDAIKSGALFYIDANQRYEFIKKNIKKVKQLDDRSDFSLDDDYDDDTWEEIIADLMVEYDDYLDEYRLEYNEDQQSDNMSITAISIDNNGDVVDKYSL